MKTANQIAVRGPTTRVSALVAGSRPKSGDNPAIVLPLDPLWNKAIMMINGKHPTGITKGPTVP